MPDLGPEVHVGDVGTLYRVRIYDEGVDFDPSGATTKQLIFMMPGGVVLTKTATVVPAGGSPATYWYLTYQVLADDGAGSPPDAFHAAAGKVKIQAYLAWADGSKFHSDIRSTDEDGRELRVYPNLE